MEITKEELAVIDVLACSSYKWMLGPYGTGFAYFSDRAIKMIKPASGNWISHSCSQDVNNMLNYKTSFFAGARKFDRGQSPNMLGMASLESSLDLFLELGLDNIQNYNQQLMQYLKNKLQPNTLKNGIKKLKFK